MGSAQLGSQSSQVAALQMVGHDGELVNFERVGENQEVFNGAVISLGCLGKHLARILLSATPWVSRRGYRASYNRPYPCCRCPTACTHTLALYAT